MGEGRVREPSGEEEEERRGGRHNMAHVAVYQDKGGGALIVRSLEGERRKDATVARVTGFRRDREGHMRGEGEGAGTMA